ncbi:MAG: hypothetical protein IKN72_07285 [Clostridia bacterium]|nr:hypothetical protein [Clostridia bacterium]
MKLKRTLAIVLSILMLLPCFLTAASAGEFWDGEVVGLFSAADGYVCTKQVQKDTDGYAVAQSFSYDRQGKPLKVAEVRKNGDVTEKAVTTYQYEYDENGNVIKKRSERKTNWSDVELVITKYAYDKRGNMIRKVEYGPMEGEKTVTVYTYDKRGNQTKIQSVRKDADGVQSRETTVSVYNSRNQPVKLVFKRKDADGYYETEKVVSVFDDAGKLVKRSYAAVTGYEEYHLTVTFDKNGGKGTGTYRSEYDNESGTLKAVFDVNGNPVKSVFCYQDDDGQNKTISYYKYDAAGNLIREIDYYYGSDDEVSKEVALFTYQKIGA